jgi:hypothetical protein
LTLNKLYTSLEFWSFRGFLESNSLCVGGTKATFKSILYSQITAKKEKNLLRDTNARVERVKQAATRKREIDWEQQQAEERRQAERTPKERREREKKKLLREAKACRIKTVSIQFRQ